MRPEGNLLLWMLHVVLFGCYLRGYQRNHTFLKNKENVTSGSDTVSHECLRNAKPEPLTPSKLDKHKLLLSSNNFSVVFNVTICMVGGV